MVDLQIIFIKNTKGANWCILMLFKSVSGTAGTILKTWPLKGAFWHFGTSENMYKQRCW